VGWRPVRQELLLGRLKPGEQLPTVKEVVDALAVNPNTDQGLSGVGARGAGEQPPGVWAPSWPPRPRRGGGPAALLASLTRWVRRARAEGLEAEEMRALLSVALDEPSAASDERASGGVA
jgi:GntR family transcriptional regulator